MAGVEFRSRWGDLHVGIAGVTKKKPKDEEVNGRKERRPKILEPVGGPDRCLLIGSFRGTKQESTWSHRKPYKPKSNRATSSITDGLLRAAHFLAPNEEFSRRSRKPIPASPPQRPHCQARNFPPVRQLRSSAVYATLEPSEIKLSFRIFSEWKWVKIMPQQLEVIIMQEGTKLYANYLDRLLGIQDWWISKTLHI